jgi:uncharacterized membrane-anchored protein
MCIRKCQSISEYMMIVMIGLAVVAAMSPYIQRSINRRLKQVRQELHESQRGQ